MAHFVHVWGVKTAMSFLQKRIWGSFAFGEAIGRIILLQIWGGVVDLGERRRFRGATHLGEPQI